MHLYLMILFAVLLDGPKDDQSNSFAAITSPKENAVFEPGEIIPIRAKFIDGNAADRIDVKKPIPVMVEFLKAHRGDEVVMHSGFAEVSLDENRKDRYDIKFELTSREPFPEGEYLIRLHCIDGVKIAGEIDLVMPSRRIKIKAKKKADIDAEPNYFAAITSPKENAEFKPGDAIAIKALFLDGDMKGRMIGKKPLVIANLQRSSQMEFVIEQTALGQVVLDEDHQDRYALECELSRVPPFDEGVYILQLVCIVDNEIVVTPSRRIRITAK